MESKFHKNDLLFIEANGSHKLLPAKIIFIGDCSVGKTSIICRYMEDRFKDNSQSTLGVEYLKKKISIDDSEIMLEIWDTAGQERYRSLIKFFYKNAKGALLVFDLCEKNSFINLGYWLKSLRMNSDKDLIIFVIGNKCDKTDKRQISTEEIFNFCIENHLEYYETSAKENIQIELVFLEMSKKIKENFENTKYLENNYHNSMSSEIYDVKHENGCSMCEC